MTRTALAAVAVIGVFLAAAACGSSVGGAAAGDPAMAKPSSLGSTTTNTTAAESSTGGAVCRSPQAPALGVPDPAVYLPGPTDPHRQAAEQAVTALVAGVHLPAGATAVCSSPSPNLTGGFTEGAEPGYLIERFRYFTVDQTPDEVLDFVRDHPPAGTRRADGSGTVGSQQTIQFSVPTDGAAFQWPGVTLAVVPIAGGTGVRVDAQTVFAPARTVAETIPDTVITVDINLGGSRHNVRYTLTGDEAKPISQAVDALWPGAPVQVAGGPCASDRGYVDELVFHLPGSHTIMVNAGLDCPNPSAEVFADGQVQPMLSGYGTGGPALSTLDTAIIKATRDRPAK